MLFSLIVLLFLAIFVFCGGGIAVVLNIYYFYIVQSPFLLLMPVFLVLALILLAIAGIWYFYVLFLRKYGKMIEWDSSTQTIQVTKVNRLGGSAVVTYTFADIRRFYSDTWWYRGIRFNYIKMILLDGKGVTLANTSSKAEAISIVSYVNSVYFNINAPMVTVVPQMHEQQEENQTTPQPPLPNQQLNNQRQQQQNSNYEKLHDNYL